MHQRCYESQIKQNKFERVDIKGNNYGGKGKHRSGSVKRVRKEQIILSFLWDY